MSKLFRCILLPLTLILTLTLGSGCARIYKVVETPEAAGPAEGMARVYFALAQSMPDGAAYIVEDTKLLGYVKNNMYFYVDVPAGEHQFMLIAWSAVGMDEAATGTLEAGKTYHFKIFVTPGFPTTRLYMTALENSGDDLKTRSEDIESCRRVELNPEEAAKWEQKFAERNSERAESFRSGEDDVKTFEAIHGM